MPFIKTRTRMQLSGKLGGIGLDQFLWYLVLGLGLPYFLIHVIVALV